MTTFRCLFPPRVLSGIALITAVFCISLMPFSGALQIHHVFAAVDHDSHEHSEFDLCQWVLHHANGLSASTVLDSVALPLELSQVERDRDVSLCSYLGSFSQSPRPPPVLFSFFS